MTKRLLALAATLAIAVACGTAHTATPPKPTVLARGSCVGIGPVAGPWDVYEDMFQADAPTWLPAHTHKGIECTLGVRGTTMWWFSGVGKKPIPPSTALYTRQGRVHTAGNDGPAPMAYFAVHVLVAGSPYRTLVADPTAPREVSTDGKSLFHSVFADQTFFAPLIRKRFSTELEIVSLPPGAHIGIGQGTVLGDGMFYYTVISGQVTAGSSTYGPYAKLEGPPDIGNPGPGAAVLGVVAIHPWFGPSS